MAINKKLIHFQNKSNFLSKLEAGEILDTSIVFIKDAKQIWTHGQLYSCPYNEEEINTLFTGETIKLINYVEIESPVDILPTDTINQAFGKIEEYLNSYTAEITAELSKKVNIIEGKGLSTEDFTTALKNKLSGLTNYDDTTIKQSITKIQTQIDTLVNANASEAIDTFNEIIAFLEGIETSSDLDSIIAAIEQQIALRYTKPADGIPASDLANSVQSALNKANTALQSYTEKYTGTITGIKMNGASKGTSGVVDLGTVITAHQDISGKLDATTAASTYATKTENNAKQDKNLYFNNKSASSWVASTAYADYGYQCDIACSGVTASMYAEVVFAPSQATSGNYAPVCETFTDKVRIYSKVNASITIPTILIEK